MRNLYLLIASILCCFVGYSQNFQVGTAEYTFFDSERNRDIPAIVYYPSAISGSNVPLASSPFGFPVVSFGHGFVIDPSAYGWLGEVLASEGYIMVLPATEGQLLPPPDHLNFGRDIRFCAEEIIRLGSLSGNPLSGKILPRYAMMGHSMGGGATYLGAAETAEVATTITFAAADTDPSSIAAALNVAAPSLVFAAEKDCVTPVSSNQIPMYQNLPAAEKAFVNIEKASHCNFTDGSASLCYLGETLPCLGSGSFITRNEQHDRVIAVLLPWLDKYLRASCSGGEDFLIELAAGNNAELWTSEVEGDALFECSENCDAPENVNVGIAPSGFSLSWNGVPDALGYRIQVRLDGSVVITANYFGNSTVIDQLDNSLPYEFRVRAFCPTQGLGGFSPWVGVEGAILSLEKQGDLYLHYGKAAIGAVISVLSMNGEERMKSIAVASEGRLNISSLPKGLYLARIQSLEEVKVLKFSIQ